MPVSNRVPLCGFVKIARNLKDKVQSVMVKNKLKKGESLETFTPYIDVSIS